MFKINAEDLELLITELETNGYEAEAKYEDEHGHCQTTLYLRKKYSMSKCWLGYYRTILSEETFLEYSENRGGESISGVFLIKTGTCTFAIVHGQAHFLVRKYCDKDFGLDLAERIVDPKGLKMKHSQTFTSSGKKDITSYVQKRKLNDSCDYGEAFSYIKCKTTDKDLWGETADFGESVRFAFNKDFMLEPTEIYQLTDDINDVLTKDPLLRLPRYHKVTDREILKYLKEIFNKHFMDFLTDVSIEDYWLTGVSFNFSNDYRYILRIRRHDMTEIIDTLDVNIIREAVYKNEKYIGQRYDLIRVVFCDEDGEPVFIKNLKDLMQATIEHEGKYYVMFHNEWVQFSDSYVSYIEEQVDSIPFEIKDSGSQNETQLIESLIATGGYTQLHKQNVYIGKYCIEKADLMDDDNVIMIKDQRQQADLVYLIKQATTSIRLTEAGELGENIFSGRNVCLWMLVNRKTLTKLSDFKSFHLLDALNDFRREARERNLMPVVWVSLEKNN